MRIFYIAVLLLLLANCSSEPDLTHESTTSKNNLRNAVQNLLGTCELQIRFIDNNFNPSGGYSTDQVDAYWDSELQLANDLQILKKLLQSNIDAQDDFCQNWSLQYDSASSNLGLKMQENAKGFGQMANATRTKNNFSAITDGIMNNAQFLDNLCK